MLPPQCLEKAQTKYTERHVFSYGEKFVLSKIKIGKGKYKYAYYNRRNITSVHADET